MYIHTSYILYGYDTEYIWSPYQIGGVKAKHGPLPVIAPHVLRSSLLSSDQQSKAPVVLSQRSVISLAASAIFCGLVPRAYCLGAVFSFKYPVSLRSVRERRGRPCPGTERWGHIPVARIRGSTYSVLRRSY